MSEIGGNSHNSYGPFTPQSQSVSDNLPGARFSPGSIMPPSPLPPGSSQMTGSQCATQISNHSYLNLSNQTRPVLRMQLNVRPPPLPQMIQPAIPLPDLTPNQDILADILRSETSPQTHLTTHDIFPFVSSKYDQLSPGRNAHPRHSPLRSALQRLAQSHPAHFGSEQLPGPQGIWRFWAKTGLNPRQGA
jgi:hypothetical protein